MGAKKKGDKKKAAPAEGDDLMDPGKVPEDTPELRLEYARIEMGELKAKYEKLLAEKDRLKSRNNELEQEKMSKANDEVDIIEHLQREILEKTSDISDITRELINAQESKDKMEVEMETTIAMDREQFSKKEKEYLEKIHELEENSNELHEFAAKKDDFLREMEQLREDLEKQKETHAAQINDIERKVLQEKDRFKKEYERKLEEEMTKLNRLTDSQLEETTKRTIKENVRMKAELAAQQKQTQDLVDRNKVIIEQSKSIKRKAELHEATEIELAKKNYATQKVMKLLTSKITSLEAEVQRLQDIASKEDSNKITHLKDYVSNLEQNLTTSEKDVEDSREELQLAHSALARARSEQQRLVTLQNEIANFILAFLEDVKHHLNVNSRSEVLSAVRHGLNLNERERVLRFLLTRLASFPLADISSNGVSENQGSILLHRGALNSEGRPDSTYTEHYESMNMDPPMHLPSPVKPPFSRYSSGGDGEDRSTGAGKGAGMPPSAEGGREAVSAAPSTAGGPSMLLRPVEVHSTGTQTAIHVNNVMVDLNLNGGAKESSQHPIFGAVREWGHAVKGLPGPGKSAEVFLKRSSPLSPLPARNHPR